MASKYVTIVKFTIVKFSRRYAIHDRSTWGSNSI